MEKVREYHRPRFTLPRVLKEVFLSLPSAPSKEPSPSERQHEQLTPRTPVQAHLTQQEVSQTNEEGSQTAASGAAGQLNEPQSQDVQHHSFQESGLDPIFHPLPDVNLDSGSRRQDEESTPLPALTTPSGSQQGRPEGATNPTQHVDAGPSQVQEALSTGVDSNAQQAEGRASTGPQRSVVAPTQQESQSSRIQVSSSVLMGSSAHQIYGTSSPSAKKAAIRAPPTAATASSAAVKPPLTHRYHEIKIGHKKAYISKTLQVDSQHQALWDEKIRPRLENDVLQIARLSEDPYASISLEFMMASAGADMRSFKPCIMIICSSESLQQRQERKTKSLKWLPSFGYRLLIFVSPVRHLAPEGLDSDSYEVEARIDENISFTVCGAAIRAVSHPRQRKVKARSTMGGLVQIQGQIYGLTVGHIFDADIDPQTEVQDSPELGDGQEASEREPEKTTEAISDSPFLEFDSGSSEEEESHTENDPDHRIPDTITDFDQSELDAGGYGLYPFTSVGRVVLRSRSKPLPSNDSLKDHVQLQDSADWAIIELRDRSLWLPNLYHEYPGDVAKGVDTMRTVKAPESGVFQLNPPCGPVSVVSGYSGLVRGILMASSVSLVIRNSLYHVKLVVLEKNLGLGDSGAWVIADGVICGHIIAGREWQPWAYMLPIDQTLEDLMSEYGTDDVFIPEADKFGYTALDSKSHVRKQLPADSTSSNSISTPLHQPSQEVADTRLRRDRRANPQDDLDITPLPASSARAEGRGSPQTSVEVEEAVVDSHLQPEGDIESSIEEAPFRRQGTTVAAQTNHPPPPYALLYPTIRYRRRAAQVEPETGSNQDGGSGQNIRFATGMRRFVPILGYHHVLMIITTAEIIVLSLLLAGCSSSSSAMTGIYLLSLRYHTSTPTNSSSQLNPPLLTRIANITSAASIEVRANYFGLCVRPSQGDWDCSSSGTSVASRLAAEQDPLNLIWTAANFKSNVILSAFIFVAIVFSFLTILLLATFPGWHEEIDENGSDREVRPFPSRPVSQVAMSLQFMASAFLGISATWQHVAAVGDASAVQSLCNGAVTTMVGATAVGLGWLGMVLAIIVWVGLLVMILSISLLARLTDE